MLSESIHPDYVPIPHLPACLNGKWKQITNSPCLRTIMRFKAGTLLPPHHFPFDSRITVLKGTIQIDDLQSSQAYLLRESEDCTVPALLVHEMQFLEDVEFEFELKDSSDLIIYWDFEERYRLGPLTATTTNSSSRFSASSANSSSHNATNTTTTGDNNSSSLVQSQTVQSGLAAGSVISIEEEAKLVYGVILSLRNFVRKLSGSQDGFISYKTSTYRLHYYETPTGLKFVMNSDPNTENLKLVLKQIYIQLYVEFVVKNGLMRFDDTRWEISQGYLQTTENTELQQQPMTPPSGNISNELFRIAVDRFIRSLKSFE
ncbi:hypothetical protein G6F57_009208 [Rhizopus arrhizus]|uniref:Trafficking protein particle complex subunit n=1 Tax=Rhizopus oryzae TaxID=64495 RepID=A0A9P6X4A2_RHIOR|nr:hypothetical protein G6F23_004269 [Rhizopus arrhizus]KAG1415775.1 hypothetical protein G6F58_006314 [Rhizopus delemar]KAG0759805.1 hypothetical protein G6F24_008800 [Rhizopus arrhizus]KAG0785554.1 hypothetical protein G6F21_009181 [Rhizopus arrhizus]KAG0793913.1 hypothetical protein G6F22_005485 [Rhizopus arrhizus]